MKAEISLLVVLNGCKISLHYYVLYMYFIVMCVIMHSTSLMDIAGVLCD